MRLTFPQLTAERRKEMVKVVHHKAEEGRVAVRNLRRAARKDLEGLEKDGDISSDELDRAEKELEHITHEFVVGSRPHAATQGTGAAFRLIRLLAPWPLRSARRATVGSVKHVDERRRRGRARGS